MTADTIIFAGNSHLSSLGVDLASSNGKNGLVSLAHPGGGLDAYTGEWPRSKGYWQSLAEIGSGQTIALMWSGNQHLSKHLIAGPDAFDLVLSSQPDLPIEEDALIIPEEAVRAQLSIGFDQFEDVIATLSNKGCRIIVCGAPAPKGDDGFIRAVLFREKHFRNVVEQFGLDAASVPLTPPLVRYKLWVVLQDIYRAIAEKHGLVFLPSPDATRDETGFLRREFWAKDATHANIDYGRIMMDTVERHVSSMRPVAAQA